MHTVHDKEIHKRKQGFLQVNVFWFQSYAWCTMMLMTCHFYTVYLCPVHTYPDIFEARDNFSPFSNKIWIIFTCPHENAKQWKYNTTPFPDMHSANSIYWMIILQSKTCIFVSPHVNEKPAFSKISTQGTCIENLSFGTRKQHLHVD